jgi:hypothetical protein
MTTPENGLFVCAGIAGSSRSDQVSLPAGLAVSPTSVSACGHLEVVERIGRDAQRSVRQAGSRDSPLVHRLDDHTRGDTKATSGLGRQENLGIAQSTPPSSRPNLRVQQSDDRRQLILQPGRRADLAQREASILERLDHSECVVEIEHEAGRYRIGASGFVNAHRASLLTQADVKGYAAGANEAIVVAASV